MWAMQHDRYVQAAGDPRLEKQLVSTLAIRMFSASTAFSSVAALA